MQPEALEEARDWLTRAERNLKAAANLLRGKEAFPEHAAFHAEQAAEGALKAFLAGHDRPFPKSLDLEHLVLWCRGIDPDFGRFLNSAQALAAYAAEPGYPGGPPEPTVPVARQAVGLAGEIVRFVRDRLFPGGLLQGSSSSRDSMSRKRSQTASATVERSPASHETQESIESRVRHELPHVSEEDARELARILGRLVAALQPERIYVFGSQARGDVTPDSDVDLLVVVTESNQPPYRRAQDAYHAMQGRSLAVDVLVMTRDEFNRRVPALASLPATVLREGKMLYAA